jgi:hypothetical protein
MKCTEENPAGGELFFLTAVLLAVDGFEKGTISFVTGSPSHREFKGLSEWIGEALCHLPNAICFRDLKPA